MPSWTGNGRKCFRSALQTGVESILRNGLKKSNFAHICALAETRNDVDPGMGAWFKVMRNRRNGPLAHGF
jgi:hypothetical protein